MSEHPFSTFDDSPLPHKGAAWVEIEGEWREMPQGRRSRETLQQKLDREAQEALDSEVRKDEDVANQAAAKAREAAARDEVETVFNGEDPKAESVDLTDPEVHEDVEKDSVNPEVLAEAQKLAGTYWKEVLRQATKFQKNDPMAAADIPLIKAVIAEIGKGNFTAPFMYDRGSGSPDFRSQKSIYELMKEAQDNGGRLMLLARRKYTISRPQVGEVLTAIDQINLPAKENAEVDPDKPKSEPPVQTDRERAEAAARVSAEAYKDRNLDQERETREEHKSNGARIFWEQHRELLREQQEAEGRRVRAEEQRAETERLEEISRREQAESRLRQEARDRQQSLQGILEEIDEADRIEDSQDRKKELEKLALKHNGKSGPGKIKDLGVEAAHRVAWSKKHRRTDPRRWVAKGNRKHADDILQTMAENGNINAAKKMARQFTDPRYPAQKGKIDLLRDAGELPNKLSLRDIPKPRPRFRRKRRPLKRSSRR